MTSCHRTGTHAKQPHTTAPDTPPFASPKPGLACDPVSLQEGPIRNTRGVNGTRGGYARCSIDKQDVIIQTEQLLALGVPRDRIYIDRGFSGTTRRNRAGLAQASTLSFCVMTSRQRPRRRLAATPPARCSFWSAKMYHSRRQSSASAI